MRAYERLMNYVKVHTTSPGRHGANAHYGAPAGPGADAGGGDARNGHSRRARGRLRLCVRKPARYARLRKSPAIGWIAHMDTAQAFSGENVKPILHENYDGGDVALPQCGRVLKTSEFPFLKELKGKRSSRPTAPRFWARTIRRALRRY